MTHADGDFLSTRKAAAALGLSPRTLDRYRETGRGPAYHRFGQRIVYRRDDLDDWAAKRRVPAADEPPPAGRRRFAGRRPRRSGPMRARATAAGRSARTARARVCASRPRRVSRGRAAGAPELALATTDTTFGSPLDTVEGIVGGTGGQLAAALAVGAALVGSVLRFNAMQLMGAVGVGIAAGAGTGIVTGLVGTAIV